MYKYLTKDAWQGFIPKEDSTSLPIKVFLKIPPLSINIINLSNIDAKFISFFNMDRFWHLQLTSLSYYWWTRYTQNQQMLGLSVYDFSWTSIVSYNQSGLNLNEISNIPIRISLVI